jgi:D-alanine-D-alanine ligase
VVKRVAVVFGGTSAEREVSRVSARAVMDGLPKDLYEPRAVAIDAAGRIRDEADSRRILEQGFRAAGEAARTASLSIFGEFDVAFPIVHGELGEDGALQGFFEVVGIPYVGSDVAASALGMNKAAFKARIREAGLPVPKSVAVGRSEWETSAASLLDVFARRLRLPVFVKPSAGGSSLGVAKVRRWEDFESLTPMERAFAYDRVVLVEEGVDAREIECAVLGNESPRASGCGEIVPGREFYDYEDKYLEDGARLLVPAPIPQAAADRIRGLAIQAFELCGCSGLARVDFFLERSTGEVFVSELNTLPGFTPISMYPRLWDREGIPMPMLLDELVRLGEARFRDERARAARRPSPPVLE